jgi:Holliday junction resolvase RusA-like endonuclease
MKLSYRDYLHQHYLHEKTVRTPHTPGKQATFDFNIAPMGAVRLSRRDAFRPNKNYGPSAAALRYFEWKDRFAALVYVAVVDKKLFQLQDLECNVWWRFYVPIPQSWSMKKRVAHAQRPCRQKPDWDNCAKAVYDAIFVEDKAVWDVRSTTLWTLQSGGCISVTVRTSS